MIWPLSRKSKKRMARICIEGPINAETRKNVLKALKQIEEREFPALLLRIDSPGGTVGDSQEIHSALLRLRDKGCHVVASFGNISASGGVYIGVGAEKIVASLRLLPAGLVVLASVPFLKRSWNISKDDLVWFFIFTFIDATLFQIFLAKGLMETGAGLGSVLIDSQPLMVAY